MLFFCSGRHADSRAPQENLGLPTLLTEPTRVIDDEDTIKVPSLAPRKRWGPAKAREMMQVMDDEPVQVIDDDIIKAPSLDARRSWGLAKAREIVERAEEHRVALKSFSVQNSTRAPEELAESDQAGPVLQEWVRTEPTPEYALEANAIEPKPSTTEAGRAVCRVEHL